MDDCVSSDELPEVQLETFNGWRILMTHIVGMPPKGASASHAAWSAALHCSFPL